MAKRIVWSKNATIDRLQILDYWHKKIGTKTYSKKLDLEIRKLIRNLRVLPEMGRKLNNTHIRYLVKDHYLISIPYMMLKYEFYTCGIVEEIQMS